MKTLALLVTSTLKENDKLDHKNHVIIIQGKKK